MPPDQDQKTERTLGLSPAQIAGSALSAVSAAFVASWAGTTGTLIGAAVGSIVATIGAALYTASLRRSSAAVRRAAAQVRQNALLPTGALPRTVVNGTARTTVGPVEAPRTAILEGTTDPDNAGGDEHDPVARRLPWGKVVLASLAVMIAALGGITAVEAVTGRPISSWLGGSSSQGTTVGHVVGTDSSPKKDTRPTNPGNTGTTHKNDATPSQDAQPSTPPQPQPSTQASQPPVPAPSVPVGPGASTAP